MPGSGRWWTSSTSTRLPAGGILSPGRTGHSDVTRELAERFGFASAAVAILADASQDPDFYEWGNPAAHAQTPDGVDQPGVDRGAVVASAQDAYLAWTLDKLTKLTTAATEGRVRYALYWLGYAIHGVEDLAPHAGRTNAEHAHNHDDHANPDEVPEHVELARSYAARFLRAVRDRLGAALFDQLRGYADHGALSYFTKVSPEVHGHGWDFSLDELHKYNASGATYAGTPVRWEREFILGRLLDAVAGTKSAKAQPADGSANSTSSKDGFRAITFDGERPVAKWTVMVYMAGDDANPNGIEYAINQDLHELKAVGSTEAVHFLAQADDASSDQGFRYRLRKGTPLEADCVAVFDGDLNTGNVGTLVNFVRWARRTHPAENYALILWGHGAGHDDENIYRLARGRVTPRMAAHLAQQRLGFFQGTRRSILDRGPQRGFGYDDTAADFLDNHELADALSTIRKQLGKPLDLLGFDACLMSMLEVAYEVRDSAQIFVASERPEPGDGWCYEEAFCPLAAESGSLDAIAVARSIVAAYGQGYGERETLAAIDLGRIAPLAKTLGDIAQLLAANPTLFHSARRAAVNCSPRGGDGYRDLGTFLESLAAEPLTRDAASRSTQGLDACIVARCGEGRGLTVYAPADYQPESAGGTDELYESQSFPRDHGWASMLRAVYPPVTAHRPRTATVSPSRRKSGGGSLFGLDRHNAHDVLADLVDRNGERWVDHLRRRLLADMDAESRAVLADIERAATETHSRDLRLGSMPNNPDRIFIVPGIMGSQLQDRLGSLQLVWIDPWGLTVGRDFEALRLGEDGLRDADPGVRIEPMAPLPILYDRLALGLTWAFGPIVEHAPYDWRKSIAVTARDLAARIRAVHAERGRVALVAHSMGGLVAAQAVASLPEEVRGSVRGLVAMGTPWQGSFEAIRALRGEHDLLRNFGLLTGRSPEFLAQVSQTFWGLCELMPVRSDLLQPRVFAPGPLSHLPTATGALRAPQLVERHPPPNTVAVVSDRQTTVIDAGLADGLLVTRAGPGDGTVPLTSATNSGSDVDIVFVNEKHVSLPLDGAAVREAVQRIRGWFGGSLRQPTDASWADLPSLITTTPTRDREELLRRLQVEDAVELRDLLALLPLA